MTAQRTAKVTPIRKPVSRPKLADISLDRDIYAEQVEASGFDPLSGVRPWALRLGIDLAIARARLWKTS